MYVISKLFTYLCLPPGIFIWILILAGFLAKRLKWLFFLGALALYMLSIRPVSNLLLSPLESFSHKDLIIPKAVVTLGGGVVKKDVLKANPGAFKREIYAVLLSKEHMLPLVFSGGGFAKEADYIKKDLDYINSVCGCDIKYHLEPKSFDTYQNAKFTAKLFEKLKLKKEIYLVTSAYHMKRAYLLFKNFGFKIITKPTDFRSSSINGFWDFFPKMGALEDSYLAIHEYFGLLSLKLRKLRK